MLFQITSEEYSAVANKYWMASAVTWNILALGGQDDNSIRLHSNLDLAEKTEPPMDTLGLG